MGGKNTRMNGEKKAFLTYQGKEFYQRIAQTMAKLNKIYLSVEDVTKYQGLNYPLIEDIHKEIGPMGGIHSILTKGKEDAFLLLPSDTPRMSSVIVDRLLEQFEKNNKNIVLMDHGRLNPMIGIYKKECLTVINELIELQEYKASNIFQYVIYEVLEFESLHMDASVIQDCNDKTSYEILIQDCNDKTSYEN